LQEPDTPDAPEHGIRELLEPDVVDQEEGSVQIMFPVKPEFTIAPGVVQGGIVAAMLDMAMAMACGEQISTVSMYFEVLRPVSGPQLRVNGNVSKHGRRIVFAEAEMHDGAGRLVARGRQTAVPIS
jgi:uncharacterized protein (TIGR00369 family)